MVRWRWQYCFLLGTFYGTLISYLEKTAKILSEQGGRLKTAISLLVTFLVLVSTPLLCKPEVYTLDGIRYVTVEDYNECVIEGNKGAKLLEEALETLDEADGALKKCEKAKKKKDWKGYFIAAGIGGTTGAIIVVIVFLVILL